MLYKIEYKESDVVGTWDTTNPDFQNPTFPETPENIANYINDMLHNGAAVSSFTGGVKRIYEAESENTVWEAPADTGDVTGCSYGSHSMVYDHDDAGNVTHSTCISCGAEYLGFHS